MASVNNIPWEEINEFLITVGRVDDLLQFGEEMLKGVRRFIPFDAGLVYFFDSKGQIKHQCLLDYDEHHSNAYIEYYHGLGETVKYNTVPNYIMVTDWSKEKKDTEFLKDFIRMRNLKYSMDMSFFDFQKIRRISLGLSRSRDIPFEKKEIKIMEIMVPHLENLARKFYFSATKVVSESYDRKLALMKMANLTKRETEIALQLCSGVSPNVLSKALHIAPTTTYKHIARIYEKMKVSNLQELLVYLLNPEAFMK